MTNTIFKTFYFSARNVSAVYYFSENNFASIYPYSNSKLTTFSEDIQNEEWYTNVTPENNPEREPVWSSLYVDSFGNGLIVTLSMTIYDRDEFKGVIGVDVTVPRPLVCYHFYLK